MLLHIDGSKHRWFDDERWCDPIVILPSTSSTRAMGTRLPLGPPLRRAAYHVLPAFPEIASSFGR